MAAFDEATRLGKDVLEVDANKDITTSQIARNLGISEVEAIAIGELGVALTVPGAPTGVVATVVDIDTVSVAFTAPASDGGESIDSYTVTSSPGGFTAVGLNSPIILDAAFVKATAYTFQVKATNSKGTGANSTASAARTPNP